MRTEGRNTVSFKSFQKDESFLTLFLYAKGFSKLGIIILFEQSIKIAGNLAQRYIPINTNL